VGATGSIGFAGYSPGNASGFATATSKSDLSSPTNYTKIPKKLLHHVVAVKRNCMRSLADPEPHVVRVSGGQVVTSACSSWLVNAELLRSLNVQELYRHCPEFLTVAQ
jgi:hypothetical protein